MAKTPIQLHGLEYTCTCCLNSALLLHGCPCKHRLGCVCVGVCGVRSCTVCICAVSHPVSMSTLTDMDILTQLLSLIQTEPPEPGFWISAQLKLPLRSPFTLHSVKSPMWCDTVKMVALSAIRRAFLVSPSRYCASLLQPEQPRISVGPLGSLALIWSSHQLNISEQGQYGL